MGFVSSLALAWRSVFAPRNRIVAAAVIATLAIGIGPATALFSVIDALLVRPLPYPDAGRIAVLTEYNKAVPIALGAGADAGVSEPNFDDWVRKSRTFELLARYRFNIFNLTGAEGAEAVIGADVAPEVFQVLGLEHGIRPIRMALGRSFQPADVAGATERVAVITHSLWRRRYGMQSGIIGHSIIVNGTPATIVGVLPEEFEFPRTIPTSVTLTARVPEVFAPLGRDPRAQRDSRNFFALGLVKPGYSIAIAQDEMDRVARELESDFPAANRAQSIRVTELQQHTSGAIRPALVLMLAAMLAVLLIACVNIANLLLARGGSRQQEAAVRAALGASRLRLVMQLLLESAILGIVGGLLGVLLAAIGLRGILAFAPANVERLSAVRLDVPVLAFGLGLSILAACLFGLVPALVLSTVAPGRVLNETARGSSGGPSQHRFRTGLVVAEVALSLVLLVGAGLLMRSFDRLRSVEPGFEVEHTASFVVFMDRPAAEIFSFTDRLITRLESDPAVAGAAEVNVPPLTGLGNTAKVAPEGGAQFDAGKEPEATIREISPGYLKVAGLSLRSGRGFTDGDTAGARPVVLLTDNAGRALFPGRDPVGRIVTMRGRRWEVVGVVGAVREFGLETPAPFGFYVPLRQSQSGPTGMVVRTRGDPERALPAIRAAVAAVDPARPPLGLRAIRGSLASSLARRRFTMVLLGVFGAVAFAMATIGLYGVLAFLVSQRARELSLRMALGATSRAVMTAFLKEGVAMAGAGVAVGIGVALAMGRLVRGLLYGVSPTDPLVFVTIASLLLVVSMLAVAIPAWRAARTDPASALR